MIYSVGIGSAGGTPIPEIDSNGKSQGFKKDEQGNIVMTRLDDRSLRILAEATRGRFFVASPGGSELETIAEEISSFEDSTLLSQQFVQYEEQFHWFAMIALILLAGEAFLPEARRVQHDWKGRFQ